MDRPHDHLIRLALEEARAALRTGDVPVGAVVAGRAGEILARDHNRREERGDPTAHAEILAIRTAAEALGGWRLTGCTLAVTLEPCTMCAGAAVLARLDRVVYAAVDPKAGAAGSLWDILRDRRLNHHPEVLPPDTLAPALAQESSTLLTTFFQTRRESPT